jgi:MFS family permease
MRERSRKTCFVMSLIAVVSGLVSYVTMRVLSAPASERGDILGAYIFLHDPKARFIGWLLFIAEIAVASWMLSRFIPLNEELYFGRHGARSWALAGFIYAMWLRSVVGVVAPSGPHDVTTVETLLVLLGILVALWIPFRQQPAVASIKTDVETQQEVQGAAED